MSSTRPTGRAIRSALRILAAGVALGGGGAAQAGGSDDCASAEPIAGEGTYAFDNGAATPGGPDNSPACDPGSDPGFGDDVWFEWTSDCAGTVTVDTCNETDVDTKIAVYVGPICPVDDATLLACNDNFCGLQSTISFTAVLAETYFIRIGTNPGAAGGTGTFTVRCYPNTGEACTSDVGCQFHDFDGHGVENLLGVTSDVGPQGLNIVADSFSPQSNGSITELCWWGVYVDFGVPVDCSETDPDAFTITYYNNDSASGLVPGSQRSPNFPVTVTRSRTGNAVLSNIGPYAEWEFHATHPPVPVTAGECVWVSVRDNSAGSCVWVWLTAPPGDGRCASRDLGPNSSAHLFHARDFDMAFCATVSTDPGACGVVGPPPNDDCVDAIPISGDGQFGFVNFAATTDGPPHAACDFFGFDGFDNDVWYCWTSPCNGQIVLSTCGLTGVDTKIAVYDGCVCPVSDATLLACNEDFCGFQSSLTFTAAAGNQYMLRIGTFPGVPGGAGAFRLTCPAYQPEPAEPFQADGEPNRAAIGDLDTGAGAGPLPPPGGTLDVAVLLPNADPGMPGAVQIFLNLGTDMGVWQGLVAQPTLFPVGADPTDIALGHFNGDPYLDIAVTNRLDDTVSILFNSANDDGMFVPGGLVTGLNEPTAIVAADLVGNDGIVDLAVANHGNDTVVILQNDGTGVFAPQEGPGVPVGGGPVTMEPVDVDGDKDIDLASGNADADSSTIIINGGDGTFSSIDVPLGASPRDLAIADFDGNGFDDIASANSGDDTVSVVRNSGPAAAAGGLPVFLPAVTLPCGQNPVSIQGRDLVGDGDADITVVALTPMVGPGIQVIENRLDAGSGLVFDPPMDIDVLAAPVFVAAGDLDGDGLSDLVTANEGDKPGAGSVTALISVPMFDCPADLDGNGDTNFADLQALLVQWGPCPPQGACPFDIDGDQLVGFGDLLVLLGTWGPCPVSQ